ncbi:S41 family peptidase [Lysobacter sp. CA199]|uniref:S41 family peptidase n=1 Tax=Lysobacter sp. CA199 TaxID=3455608 RepID=UPI003F8D44B3
MRHVLRSLPLLLSTALFCGAPLSAQAATVPPRDAVAEVAQAIERHFYDPKRAGKIAADLRSEAGQGRYDRYTDPRDLATALTSRLSQLDGHLRVNWRQPEAKAATAPSPALRRGPAPVAADEDDFSRRRNYGLRKVEVLPGNLGYIDLRELPDLRFGDPSNPVRRALDAALQLVSATDAVIFDLRDNAGGSPAAVGYLISAFTPKHADIYNTFRFREGERMQSVSEAPLDWHSEPRLQVPLYVLTSPRTGSAGEALAYTLQSAGRAVVIGEHSAGAANPGAELPLPQGFSVFVASGSPTNPITRRNWEGDGVTPDVAVPQAQALAKAQQLALEKILARPLAGAAQTDARWTLDALRVQSAPPPELVRADYLGQYDRMQIGDDGGRLFLRNGKRPPQPLIALQRDLFCVADDPSLRLRFERDATGKVASLETLRADGSISRYRR